MPFWDILIGKRVIYESLLLINAFDSGRGEPESIIIFTESSSASAT